MTKEDKKLLLKDLSARLSYGVKIELMPITRGKCTTLTPTILGDYYISDNVNYHPYLRPMSSMTEEEYKEYTEKLKDIFYGSLLDNALVIDWLNAHHFDYHGLIKMGLALEAPNEIYNN